MGLQDLQLVGSSDAEWRIQRVNCTDFKDFIDLFLDYRAAGEGQGAPSAAVQWRVPCANHLHASFLEKSVAPTPTSNVGHYSFRDPQVLTDSLLPSCQGKVSNCATGTNIP